ncbi:MAG: hypothetical protein ACR2QK_18720 [Acidimicrobiales bacterium]
MTERGISSRSRLLGAVLGLFALLGFVALPIGAATAQTQVPAADVRISGSVEERPPSDGATTGSEMRYRLTIENRGPDPIPANGISLVIFVDRSDSTDTATIEVSRFSSGGLSNIPGSVCGRGRHQVLRCTNRQQIEPGRDISLDIGHRHPVAIAGQLSFFAEVSPRNNAFIDAGESNNAFRGPSYVFQNPPATTTTTLPTTTVLPTSTTGASTTTDPSSTTTTNGSSSTTEAGSTTTSSSSTTTTASTTTTTAPPTTTTTAPSTTTTSTAPTTALVTTSSLALLSDSSALPSPDSSLDPGSGGSGEQGVSDASVVLGPRSEDDGGPPYLFIAAVLAGFVLLGGVGLAAYVYYERDPPLVDIRRYQ